jgi:hypothetical protein
LEFGDDPLLKSMFDSSVGIELGDGNLTLFATDRWLSSTSSYLIAPELCKLIRSRVRKTRTVSAAMLDKLWIQDIAGTLTVKAIAESLLLWQIMEEV